MQGRRPGGDMDEATAGDTPAPPGQDAAPPARTASQDALRSVEAKHKARTGPGPGPEREPEPQPEESRCQGSQEPDATVGDHKHQPVAPGKNGEEQPQEDEAAGPGREEDEEQTQAEREWEQEGEEEDEEQPQAEEPCPFLCAQCWQRACSHPHPPAAGDGRGLAAQALVRWVQQTQGAALGAWAQEAVASGRLHGESTRFLRGDDTAGAAEGSTEEAAEGSTEEAACVECAVAAFVAWARQGHAQAAMQGADTTGTACAACAAPASVHLEPAWRAWLAAQEAWRYDGMATAANMALRQALWAHDAVLAGFRARRLHMVRAATRLGLLAGFQVGYLQATSYMMEALTFQLAPLLKGQCPASGTVTPEAWTLASCSNCAPAAGGSSRAKSKAKSKGKAKGKSKGKAKGRLTGAPAAAPVAHRLVCVQPHPELVAWLSPEFVAAAAGVAPGAVDAAATREVARARATGLCTLCAMRSTKEAWEALLQVQAEQEYCYLHVVRSWNALTQAAVPRFLATLLESLGAGVSHAFPARLWALAASLSQVAGVPERLVGFCAALAQVAWRAALLQAALQDAIMACAADIAEVAAFWGVMRRQPGAETGAGAGVEAGASTARVRDAGAPTCCALVFAGLAAQLAPGALKPPELLVVSNASSPQHNALAGMMQFLFSPAPAAAARGAAAVQDELFRRRDLVDLEVATLNAGLRQPGSPALGRSLWEQGLRVTGLHTTYLSRCRALGSLVADAQPRSATTAAAASVAELRDAAGLRQVVYMALLRRMRCASNRERYLFHRMYEALPEQRCAPGHWQGGRALTAVLADVALPHAGCCGPCGVPAEPECRHAEMQQELRKARLAAPAAGLVWGAFMAYWGCVMAEEPMEAPEAEMLLANMGLALCNTQSVIAGLEAWRPQPHLLQPLKARQARDALAFLRKDVAKAREQLQRLLPEECGSV